MKSVLIFEPKNKLKSTGGPEGYLYNLNLGLEKISDENIKIEFLDDINLEPSKLKKIGNKLPRILRGILKIFNGLKLYKNMSGDKLYQKDIDFNNYDYIHFHYTFDLYKNKSKLKEFNGKIILTSHSPKPYFLEYIDKVYDLIKFKFVYKILSKFENVDKYAFENTDYIFFPCEEAEEPYLNNWEFYRKFKKQNQYKYRYILTGITPKKALISKEEIRKKYNIPENAFVITYIGRHNIVKGFDSLKKIGERLFNMDSNIYVLCAGKEEPLCGLKHKNWIEVGWTNDPYSIINAGDLFILPNKETYFDIVFLEVISLGKMILATNTGGNKYFTKYGTNAIKLYSNEDDAVNMILEIKKAGIDEEKIYKELLNIFEEDYSSIVFAKNYIELIKRL